MKPIVSALLLLVFTVIHSRVSLQLEILALRHQLARQSCTIIREVAEVTRTWQAVAVEVGARRAEITRIASAFEHEDLQAALKL